ncbi:coiled-coil domain-containing protein 55-domain containing protein [Obelidium mucronatum]|nr:coiled-coil domain-containing protein 55-domain containing protein [Obelidium mucronatum]
MGGDAGSDARKKPRYVGALLAAAQQRKIELERVEDRKVARERELEGEEFKDKDAFVTDAFKKHKDDMRKLEEEEERKAKLAKSAGGDMSVFYRTVLDQHEQIATNSHLSKKDLELAAKEREQRNREKLLEEKEKMEDAVRRGELKINANNEIVDKRALLKSGLNISKTKVRTLNEEREADERDRRKAEDERRAKERQERDRKHAEMEKRRQKEEQARRLLEETERQKRESDRKRAQEIAKEKEQVAATMAKKATEEVVMDARARYLARKKQEQEQQRSGKDEDDSD